MSNDPSANPLDKNQAIQEILYKKREIARLQEHFGITTLNSNRPPIRSVRPLNQALPKTLLMTMVRR
jgi:hypothetical protein